MASAAKKSVKGSKQILFLAVLAVLMVICNIITGGKFITFDNQQFILAHSIFYVFISWAMIFIFTPGITDLSIGANVLLAGNIGAICAMDLGMGYAGLILMTILSAAIMEFVTVFCTVGLKIPSWIAGLGMALIYEAILSTYTGQRAKTVGSNVIQLDKSFRALGSIPIMIIFLIAGFIVCYILFNKTTTGFNITAVGGNPEVSKAMGINVKKTIIIGAIIGGIFIGVAAILQESYVGKMYSTTGLASLSSIFRSLAIMLLGASFSNVFSMPLSVLICGIAVTGLFNFLTLIGIPSGTGQDICLGALVIICGVISHWKYKGVVK